MKKLPKTLVFLGSQASGKNTQAELLAEKISYQVFDAGTLLREFSKGKSEEAISVKERIEAGRLVKPEVASRVVNDCISKLGSGEGVIVIGYPRELKQYDIAKKTWSKIGRDIFLVFYIDITDEEAIKRMRIRSKKEGRSDDRPEAIKKRLAWSKSHLEPMAEKLESEGCLIRVNGMQEIKEVHQEILDKLKSYENPNQQS